VFFYANKNENCKILTSAVKNDKMH